MTRTFILVVILLSLLSTAFAASLPGQDINARANLTYSTESQISATASLDYLDHTSAPAQAASQPSSTVVLSTETPISAGPATAFVVPDASAPLYFTYASSLYTGPSLVGQRVKLAGKFFTQNGLAFIDDGSAVVAPDPLQNGVVTRTRLSVGIRTDLLSTLPAEGSMITVQGVVRQEADGQCTLLPISDSSFVTALQGQAN